jgi:NADH-quinone oxidoreductase subunit N
MLAIIILFITGLCTLFASFTSQKQLPKYLGLIGIVAAMATLFLKLGIGMEFPEFFTMHSLARMMTVISLCLLFFIFLVSGNYEKNYDWSVTLSLMLFSTCGVILLFGMSNLLTLFLGIEIMSIPLYVLAASKRNNAYSLEAGLKYFIMGSFSSAFLLFGIALIYGTFGSFHIDKIVEIQSTVGQGVPHYFQIGLLFLIISLVFKMALAPFHFWSPDVYDGSPTIVTAFMSTIIKLGSIIAMYYILAGFFAFQFDMYIKYLVPILSISMLVGSILGLVQKNVKRTMAYSSITHMGFVLASIIVGMATQNIGIFTFYLIAYTVAGLLAFIIINHLRNGDDVQLDDLNGLATKQPILALCLAIAIFSMAGIPLTGGFIAKFNVLSGLMMYNKWLFGIGLLSSAISIGFYLRIINRIYFFENSLKNVAERKIIVEVVSVILSLIIIILGLIPSHIPAMIKTYFFL